MTQIVKVPAEVLRNPAKKVEGVDKKVLGIIEEMRTALLAQKNPEGVGLAAPQIGISLRIFFIRPFTEGSKAKPEPKLFINPEITNFSRDTISPESKRAILEGCLSLPGYYGHVERSKSVTIRYQTITSLKSQVTSHNETTSHKPQATMKPQNWDLGFGIWDLTERIEVFSGFPAQIIQHEFDHLNGKLFIDRILEQKGKLFEVKDDHWHEVGI